MKLVIRGEDIILSHIVFDNEAPLIITQAQGNIFTKESNFSLPLQIQDISNVKTEILLNGIRMGIYEIKDFTPQLRLREGSNSIVIKSRDQLENISEYLVLNNIVLDTIKPKINLANINTTQHEKLFTIQASINDANLNLVQLFQNGVKVFEGNVSSINQSINLEAGRNFFTIIARDKSSNESTDATLEKQLPENNFFNFCAQYPLFLMKMKDASASPRLIWPSENGRRDQGPRLEVLPGPLVARVA